MQAEQSAWSTRSYDKVSVLSVFKFHPEEVAIIKERGAVLLKFLDIFNLIYCCPLFTVLNFPMAKRKKNQPIKTGALYPSAIKFVGTLLAFNSFTGVP